MNQQFNGNHRTLKLLPSGLIETIWETLIALAVAAAISIGVISPFGAS
jgi:hypothetical protein